MAALNDWPSLKCLRASERLRDGGRAASRPPVRGEAERQEFSNSAELNCDADADDNPLSMSEISASSLFPHTLSCSR